MGRIPTITNQVSARSGRTNAGIPTRQASAAAFGGAQADALQSLGGGLMDLGAGLDTYQQQKKDEKLANAVAQADFTPRELELRNEVGPDADGYRERALEEFDAWVDEEANKIDDDDTRQRFRNRMATQRTQLSSRAATYEFSTAAEYSDQQTNQSLVTLDNRVRVQPERFEELLAQGVEVVQSSTSMPSTAKAAAVDAWTQHATRSYFEGRLESASDVHDVDAILEDMQGEEFTSRLSSQGLDGLLSTAKATRNAILTKADADARAAVEFLEGRSADLKGLIPAEEMQAAQALVEKSENPMTQARMARISRDQEIVRSTRRLPPDQQREIINGNNGPSYGDFPVRVNSAINVASSAMGVSSSYMAGMVEREFGQQLNGENTDYGTPNVTGDSDAVGIAQIIPSTALDLAKNPAVRTALMDHLGIDTSSMSNAEILALRTNPEASLIMAAGYAAQNAGIIQRITGKPATDGELYMAHFLGGGGAARLLRMMRADANVQAADMFPAGAKANKKIFYKGDGTPRNVREVYEVLTGSFSGGQTYVEAGDADTRNRILKDTEKGLSDDPMTFANGVGNTTLSDVNTPEGIIQRGKEARSVADYYNIPYNEMQPLTKTEASSLGKAMADGGADDVLNILSNLQGLGGRMADAAMRQISDVDEVYGFAGKAMAEGNGAVASDIVRGQKRLEENPQLRDAIGATDFDLDAAFRTTAGGALMDLNPRDRQAAFDAAKAHYAETTMARGGAGQFNADAFGASINAVLGGSKDAPRLQEVNGETTLLPPGVDAEFVEEAMGAMTRSDWIALSPQRTPPRYVDGTVADPLDIASEGVPRHIGGDEYRIAMDDGTYLVTGNMTSTGRMETYTFVMDQEAMQGAIDRRDAAAAQTREQQQQQDVQDERDQQQPRPSVQRDGGGFNFDMQRDIAGAREGGLTPEELQALRDKYGAAVDGLEAD